MKTNDVKIYGPADTVLTDSSEPRGPALPVGFIDDDPDGDHACDDLKKVQPSRAAH